ncbi:transposase [Duganella callida]|uniref:Transposase n=1 Tax=Duganella callida TaxID=2561932 RepID=A0A4Y9SKN7_9BURK|nr:transposase [Duganella callida]TFW27098.1 transposase [Duganella callida]
MSRPLRLEFPGCLYHVTARGDRQQAIFRSDTDRLHWLELLENTCARFNFTVYSFCQMGNHYHILLETGEANLSRGMRQLNGTYSQYFNRRYRLVGHVFQGRYSAILVQKEAHLRELARYVVLNPVRAGLVKRPEDWAWSSYRLTVQDDQPPVWLNAAWMLAQFGSTRREAILAYQRFVANGMTAESPIKHARHKLLLGDDSFINRYQQPQLLNEVTKEHRRALALPLAQYQASFPDRDMAMAQAYFSTAYTMSQIAGHFGVSYRTVSRIVQRVEAQLKHSSCAIGRTDPR